MSINYFTQHKSIGRVKTCEWNKFDLGVYLSNEHFMRVLHTNCSWSSDTSKTTAHVDVFARPFPAEIDLGDIATCTSVSWWVLK